MHTATTKNWWKGVVGVKKRFLASEPSQILHPPRLWRLSWRRLWDRLGTAALLYTVFPTQSPASTDPPPPPPPPPANRLYIFLVYFSNSLWAFFFFSSSFPFPFLFLFFIVFSFSFHSHISFAMSLSWQHYWVVNMTCHSTWIPWALTLQVHSHHRYHLPTDNKANVWHWTWELHIVTATPLVTIMTAATTAGLACEQLNDWRPRKPLGVIIIMALPVPLRKWPMMVPAMYGPCSVWIQIQIQNNNYENNYLKFL